MADPTEACLVGLTPTARAYAIQVVNELREAGLPAVIVEGYRSQKRQNELLTQGQIVEGGKRVVVTWTLNSKHTQRIAWDIAFMPGGKLTWNVPEAWWSRIGTICRYWGLKWGGDFRWPALRDRPHVELPTG